MSDLKIGRQAMSDWQPIETAPKDGTRVACWQGCYRALHTVRVHGRCRPLPRSLPHALVVV
jgi:hypothetical protein